MKRRNHNPILDRMRDDFDIDAWGTAMGWAFGVAEVIHFRTGLDVPAGLGYSPSVIATDVDTDSYPDNCVLEIFESGIATPEDLVFAAKCLDRYLDWLRAAGLDY